jgi:flagellar biosynthetic protein FliR
MLETTLQDFVTNGVFAFILTFVRIGSALMIMPGLGDSFTPQRVRLVVALGISLALSPFVSQYMPSPLPPMATLAVLLVAEFIIGIFIGTIARILMAALDTAGMVISFMSGLGNAQIFNPSSSAQGSIIGALFSITGMLILFATNMHHLLIYGIIGSYDLFPLGNIPDTADMSEMVAATVSQSFLIGVQMSAPFMVMSLLVYIGMGVLTRLMPQIQVFILSLPIQILLSMLTLFGTVSVIMLFWISRFENGLVYLFSLG